MSTFDTSLSTLRYVVASSQLGSFRQAGAVLNVEESRISRRIRELEGRLGVPVFERRYDGVRLTTCGREFVATAKQILLSVDESVGRIAALGGSDEGPLRIGVCFALGNGPLRALLNDLKSAHPDIGIEITGGTPSEHYRNIADHQIDIAFLPEVISSHDFEHVTLWSERLFIAVGSDHPLADKHSVRWDDVNINSLIQCTQSAEYFYGVVSRRTARGAVSDAVDVQRVSRSDIISIVAMGWGVSFELESSATRVEPGVTCLPVSGEKVAIGAVWRRTNRKPSLRSLLRNARKVPSCA